MTRRCLLVVMLLLVSALGWAQTTAFKDGVRRGQIKVKFSSEVSTSALSNASARSGQGIITGIQAFDAAAQQTQATRMYRLFPSNAKNESKLRRHGLDRWYVVEIDENVDPKIAVAKFKNIREVALAEVDREKTLAPFNATPYTSGASPMAALPFNDPLLKDQWHYHNSGQVGVGDADINLFEAWTHTAGANNIIVSIHDEGIDVAHKDLRNNIWVNTAELSGAPGVDDDQNGYVDDINGFNFPKNIGAVDAQMHGTHVAGTIAAVNNNGIGVSGIAGGTGNNDGVKVMSLQIFGGLFENSYIYAADNGAVISQNSWGYTNPGIYDQSLKEAIDYFIAEAGNYPGSPMKGGIVIFASGNSNTTYDWYPGYFPNVLAVSSLGPEWKKAFYSNYGEWVELSAPGGDQNYGTKGGVLSTFPRDQYGYLQGTSMACPHVSGIAALAVANRTHQLTNTELWTKLVTGVVNIDEANPDYIGQLGSGAIDASLAIKSNMGINPAAISDLNVKGISQEFATLSWTVPADGDDGSPNTFQLYYHTQPIDETNFGSATEVTIRNTKLAGEVMEYEVDGLQSLTTYYFAITSTDRWGNVSVLSNTVSETTNQGPAISVDEGSQSIELSIDAASGTTATHEITIINSETGILRWNHFMRHRSTALSFNASGLNYPTVTQAPRSTPMLGRVSAADHTTIRTAEAAPMAFTEITKGYANWAEYMVGETELDLTNSIAVKFSVSEPEGFNLTQVRAYIDHNPEKGPVILEIYKGDSPAKNNLIYAQEHSNYGDGEMWAYITLDEQLYFDSGDTFWVVIHVPAGNLFPFGMGGENDPDGSKNCFMSFNMGATWIPMEEAVNDKRYAWVVNAVSENAALGTYLSLEPGSGDVDANSQATTMLTADASNLINGAYSANLVISSNDTDTKELRIPVTLTVSGHQPDIRFVDVADFGNVFVGDSKVLELVLDNRGLGNFNDANFTVTNAAFTIEDYAPWQIPAREQVSVRVKFSPTSVGQSNGVLSFTNGVKTYTIPLFGIGAATSKISVTPATQTINNLTIGDETTATITVGNTGSYPLKYFVPGFDSRGISDNWPTDYHKYGYQVRSNLAGVSNPLAYQFQDISGTGVDITDKLKTDRVYFAFAMGFDFPYYGKKMDTLYVAQKGFTTFDGSVRPLNVPGAPLGNSYNPKGYICPLGYTFSYFTGEGKIFYRVEADRVIVQYDNVVNENGEHATAQMVLFANGDIRFYYAKMEFSDFNKRYIAVLMEDYDQSDAVILNVIDYKEIDIKTGTALGFDYPGPNIISAIENGSGTVAPGATQTVIVTMNTDSLAEGAVRRAVNFISNDPTRAEAFAVVNLNITQGGVAKPIVSTDTILFGNVYQGAVKSDFFTVKNKGTRNSTISSLKFVNSKFTVVGTQPTVVKPGLYTQFEVKVPTTSIAALQDWLSINYSDGTHDTIYVKANVVVAPAITLDLTLLQKTVAQGDSIGVPYTVKNTGLGTLDFTATGKQWLSFDAPAAPSEMAYTYEKENTGGVYQWIDILRTGTHLPMSTVNDWDGTFWNEVTLPFPVEFYGEYYTKFKIGESGLISFEENPTATVGGSPIPAADLPGPAIMPYWSFAGFNTMFYPAEDVGVFYQTYDNMIVVTWSYLYNMFGGRGDAMSAQVILYKNGTMKFQYRVEDSGTQDLTSILTAIGLQKDHDQYLVISDRQEIDHGQGLAYVILPAKKFSVAPGATLTGSINIDARNVYGGVYNEVLKIQTNVPAKENLQKPVQLTVTGEANFKAPETIDFESQMIALEWGSPKAYPIDITFENDGVAPYDITWMKMADGLQGLSLQLEVDGMWGKEWWDIAYVYDPFVQIPTYTIRPGDVVKARAVFYPTVAGDFTDDLIVTTSLGDKHIVLKGSAIEPPAFATEEGPIDLMFNLPSDVEAKDLAFNNLDGKTDLTYALSVEYRREPSTAPTMAEPMTTAARTAISSSSLKSVAASGRTGASTQATAATYNRTISHTTRKTPDTFIGNGGSAITLATTFNAGPDGFNITHIETYMRTEAVTSGTLEVAVRAGGESILGSPVVATGKLEFTGNGADGDGKWYTIKLDKSAVLYPNEEFYVSVTYPFGIEHAQGSINDSPTITNRYLYEEEGYWFDVQNISGLENIGWLMVAAEEAAPSWLSITSDASGTVAPGEAGTASISIQGASAQRGNQYANIVFATNDPYNPTVKIPVKLHLNEGPVFSGASTTFAMAEGDTVTLQFNVTDKEKNAITVAAAQAYEDVQQTYSNGKLVVTLTPGYDDAGSYTYTFDGSDEYGAVTSLKISVEVTNANQPPVYIADASKTLEYNSVGNLIEYSVEDFFTDPDNDEMTLTVTNGNAQVVEVFASDHGFLLRPMAMGQTTLAFTVMDGHGNITRETLTVKVNSVLGVEEEANAGVKVYPNPVKESANLHLSYEWKGAVKLVVVDATGRQYLTEEVEASQTHDLSLNVSHLRKGFYILHAASQDKNVAIKLIKE